MKTNEQVRNHGLEVKKYISLLYFKSTLRSSPDVSDNRSIALLLLSKVKSFKKFAPLIMSSSCSENLTIHESTFSENAAKRLDFPSTTWSLSTGFDEESSTTKNKNRAEKQSVSTLTIIKADVTQSGLPMKLITYRLFCFEVQ